MESPLEVLSRVAFMVNKTLPQQVDYGSSLQKYGVELGRLSCWRVKDFTELQLGEGELQRPLRKKPLAATPLEKDSTADGRGETPRHHATEEATQCTRTRCHASLTPLAELLQRVEPEPAAGHPAGCDRQTNVRRSPGFGGEENATRAADSRSGGDVYDATPLGTDASVEPLNLSLHSRPHPTETKPVARCPGVTSKADPAVEEHFRRSLGSDYNTQAHGGNRAHSHVTASVDEHFKKSLGAKWIKPTSAYKNHQLPGHVSKTAASQRPPVGGGDIPKQWSSPPMTCRQSGRRSNSAEHGRPCLKKRRARWPAQVSVSCGHAGPGDAEGAAPCPPSCPLALPRQNREDGLPVKRHCSREELTLRPSQSSPLSVECDSSCSKRNSCFDDGTCLRSAAIAGEKPSRVAPVDAGQGPLSTFCLSCDSPSVDEHFAKALGDKWAEIQRSMSSGVILTRELA